MMGGAEAGCWWQPRPALRRYVCDLVEDELFRQRRSGGRPPQSWPEALAFDRDLGVDSLERLALATALAESLHLHESGIEDYLLARHTLSDWLDIAEAGLARFSARMTFRTSGSSGVARPCMHPLASLLQETGELAAVFQGRRRLLQPERSGPATAWRRPAGRCLPGPARAPGRTLVPCRRQA